MTSKATLKGMAVDIHSIKGIVATVKDEAALAAALKSPCETLFILYGTISTIESIVHRAKRTGRCVLVNIDMVDGYAPRASAVDHVRRHTPADGILSSKAAVVRAAREAGLIGIQRLFMIDSFAYHQIPEQIKSSQACGLEILPGCVPRVLSWIRADTDLPLIAGGLVCDANDARNAMRVGAQAVATSCQALWSLGRDDLLADPRQPRPLAACG